MLFEELFGRDSAVREHLAAPLAECRLAYLTHYTRLGASRDTLQRVATAQLAVVRHLDCQAGGPLTLQEVEDAAERWCSLQPGLQYRKGAPKRRLLVCHAVRWLRFADRLQPPAAEPHAGRLEAFERHMREERGLAESTIRLYRLRMDRFFRTQRDEGRDADCIALDDVDAFLARKGGRDGLARATLRSYACALRAFCRFAEPRGWCVPQLAGAIASPRIYRDERLPSGPSPDEVRRLLESSGGDSPADLRDRAVLLLLSVYGLRAGEVAGLRLDDIVWESETIRVRRSKTGRADAFPLARSVGDAILRYLCEARPRRAERAVFFTLAVPVQPVSSLTISSMVLRRMRRIGVRERLRGPHSLRHACAQRLLDRGFSLHEIGHCLGHRSLDSTAIYAKVGLEDLRAVGEIDLETLA